MRWFPLCAVALLSCVEPEPPSEQIVWLDAAVFEAEVLPILGERCGNPTCHGRDDRPLSLYSVGRWRADAERTFLNEPLTAAELEHDYGAACAFAAHGGISAMAPLLLKPQGEEAGVYHGGGVVLEGPADREYRVLSAWIEAGRNP